MKRVTSLLPDDVKACDVLLQRPPTFREIIEACAAHYNVEIDHVLGGGTDRAVSHVRNCAFWIGRRYTRHSCDEMAHMAGRLTHHPCTTALNRIAGRLQVEEKLRDDIEIIERRIAQVVLDWRFMPCR